MKYKLTHGFYDAKDDLHHYVLVEGATYPREGVEPSEERIADLRAKGWIGEAIEEAKKELKDLKKAELVELATDLGLEFDKKAKNDELVSLIEAEQTRPEEKGEETGE